MPIWSHGFFLGHQGGFRDSFSPGLLTCIARIDRMLALLADSISAPHEHGGGRLALLSTLENGLRVLALFSKRRPTMTIAEMARETGLRENTMYRYVATLKASGLIEESPRRGYYQLGMKCLEFSSIVQCQISIGAISLPIMRDLAFQTGETILLAAIHGHRGICLEKIESSHMLRVAYERGSTFHLHAGSSGKVLLAYMSDAARQEILSEVGLPRLTSNTTTDVEELTEELRGIRRQGYCVTDGEQLDGIRGISAPVLDGAGRVRACLNVEGPIRRLEGRPTDEAIRLARRAAKEITARLEQLES